MISAEEKKILESKEKINVANKIEEIFAEIVLYEKKLKNNKEKN
mgnify:CR=1 FL=1